MSTLTAEQVLEQHVALMGPELGSIYNRLYNECIWLHMKWAHYVELDGSSQERIYLLNAAAPTLFMIMERVVWDDVLLHVARLTDSPSPAGRETLTIQRLPGLVHTVIKAEVQQLVTRALSAAKFAREHRHRRLAHSDLADALGRSVQPEPTGSRNEVQAALAAIADVLNRIDRHYCQTECLYEGDGRSAVGLLYTLRDGIEADKARRARFAAGDYEELLQRPL